jgi:predicted phage terminase large subunit-like protein
VKCNPEELLSESFEDFVVQAFAYTHPDTELNFAPYLRYLCFCYQRLKKGDRIVFNQPARTLKSWIAKFYAAWYLGHHPGAKVMIISNIQRLADRHLYDVRKLLRAKFYLRTFPRTRIAADRAGVSELETTKGGGLFAGSVKGAVAGFGADLLLVDDPNKIGDASQPERLQHVNQTFDGEIYSRLNNKLKGIVVVVQHRLNDNDLSGHLIRQEYKQVTLPLIATRNKVFRLAGGEKWLRRKGEILANTYSTKDVERAKLAMPDYFWFCQQGSGQNIGIPLRFLDFGWVSNPVAVGPPVISIDSSQRGGPSNSFNVIQVWQKTQTGHHLFSQFREQCTFAVLESATIALVKKWRPAAVLIENTAHGGVLLIRMKTKFKKYSFVAIEPQQSKAKRLDRHRAAIRKGMLSVEREDWGLGYIKELVSFPAGDDDDQVDATTQYLDFMATNPSLKQPPTPGLMGSSRQSTTYRSPNIAIARGSSIFRKRR